jgi:hypothetical protein
VTSTGWSSDSTTGSIDRRGGASADGPLLADPLAVGGGLDGETDPLADGLTLDGEADGVGPQAATASATVTRPRVARCIGGC